MRAPRTGFRAALCAAIAVHAAIYALNLIGGLFDRDTLRATIADAFHSGELGGAGLVRGDSGRGINQYNDCLILQTVLLTRNQPFVDAASAQTVTELDACGTLRMLAVDRGTFTSQRHDYDRYVFGARTVSLLALQAMPLHTNRVVASMLLWGMLGAALGIGLVLGWGWIGATKPGEGTDTGQHAEARTRIGFAIAIASGALMSVYGLHLFARNLGHVYSEIVIVGYLLAALLTIEPEDPRLTDTIAAVFGALTACFELLTGPLVVGAVLVGIVAAQQQSAARVRDALAYTWGRIAVYLGAFGMTMLLQQVLASALTGRNAFADFGVHLALRLQLHHVFDITLPPAWQISTNLAQYGVADILRSLGDALPLIAYGSFGIGVLIVAAATVLAAYGLMASLRSGEAIARARAITLATLLLVVPVWYTVFSNHTVLHSLYMIRLVSAFAIVCAVLALSGWLASIRVRSRAATAVRA